MFNDTAFRDEMNLSAVNSINWARIMAQVVYYFTAGIALGAPDRPIGFSVPSGNFGNVFAGYAAGRMGLPVSQLIVASNSNDILARFLENGDMTMAGVQPTYSPSMDIQVSSNFERLLFDLLDQDGTLVKQTLTGFRESGSFTLERDRWQRVRRLFDGFRLDDEGTLAEIKHRHETCGELLDPHSAIGTAAAAAVTREDVSAMVALATAHPAKFPDAVEKATGLRPGLPRHLSDLLERPERMESLPNDLSRLQDYVAEKARPSNRRAQPQAAGA